MAKKATAVSWPGKHGRITEIVHPWEPPASDPLDAETGWPKPGHWEPQHVRSAIREAMQTLQRLPMPKGGRPDQIRSAMPAVIREAVEAYGWQDLETRVEPSPAEIDFMDRVFDWLFWLPFRDDVLIVTGVALGCHYRAIGRITGKHHEECRRAEKAACIAIANRLNGKRS